MKIYVLHEYGANNHYNGLKELCSQNKIKLLFREFRFMHLIGSGIKHRDFKKISKQFINLCFLINLFFTVDKTIILGMHPYDWRMPILIRILKRHRIYYHTSFTTWDPKEMNKFKGTSLKKIQRIKNFTNNIVVHIFAVTKTAKNSIVNFCECDPQKISVVYHSYMDNLQPKGTPNRNSFIYVGRLEQNKGIKEICDYFAIHPEYKITIIGDGINSELVNKFSKSYKNIQYIGYLKGLKKIKVYYENASYFILNSKRSEEWEELFGQVLIESMACGCIPIAVNHSGPREIITNMKNGFLFEEGNLHNTLDYVNTLTNDELAVYRSEAINRGHYFESPNIASKWNAILKKDE